MNLGYSIGIQSKATKYFTIVLNDIYKYKMNTCIYDMCTFFILLKTLSQIAIVEIIFGLFKDIVGFRPEIFKY